MAPGHPIELDWQGRSVSAWVPDPLVDLAPIGPPAAAAARAALASVVRADAALPAPWESLARILLRTEGIASSSVEGITAPVAEVFVADVDITGDGDASWIADNLAVVDAAQHHDGALTVDVLHAWHERLLRHGHLPDELVGRLRDGPGWIGGTSPVNAAYVPPPHERLPLLMDDLVAYANRDEVDPIVQAALVHAQFETIHPYGDGNGRLGRVLVGWVLARRLRLERLAPPVSVLVARDPGGYLSGLWQFREGSIDEWVRWFATIIDRAADATHELVSAIDALAADWADRTSGLRADASARAALDVLLAHPVLTAQLLADELAVSTRSARTALHTLAELRVVEPYEPQRPGRRARPRHWWAATELLDIVRAAL